MLAPLTDYRVNNSASELLLEDDVHVMRLQQREDGVDEHDEELISVGLPASVTSNSVNHHRREHICSVSWYLRQLVPLTSYIVDGAISVFERQKCFEQLTKRTS